MRFMVDAACGCNMGKVRKNNEDNFFFNSECLDLDNQGLHNTAYFSDTVKNGLCFAIFDGMGGESYGEVASFTAARKMQTMTRSVLDNFISARRYLLKLAAQLNDAIVEVKKELRTERSGSTMAALYFSSGRIYACNIGDSRIYRLRDGALLQLSVDHVEKRPEGARRKAPLTQHLGIEPEDLQIEPHIAKSKLCNADTYLLCSDGLTDMLTDLEISDIMSTCENPADCVDQLIRSALERGGRDNITAIVCRIKK